MVNGDLTTGCSPMDGEFDFLKGQIPTNSPIKLGRSEFLLEEVLTLGPASLAPTLARLKLTKTYRHTNSERHHYA